MVLAVVILLSDSTLPEHVRREPWLGHSLPFDEVHPLDCQVLWPLAHGLGRSDFEPLPEHVRREPWLGHSLLAI